MNTNLICILHAHAFPLCRRRGPRRRPSAPRHRALLPCWGHGNCPHDDLQGEQGRDLPHHMGGASTRPSQSSFHWATSTSCGSSSKNSAPSRAPRAGLASWGAVDGCHFRMMNPDRTVPGIAVDRREKRPLFDRDGRPVSALSFDDVPALSAGGRRCELNQGARPRGCRVRWGLGLPACASSEYRIC